MGNKNFSRSGNTNWFNRVSKLRSQRSFWTPTSVSGIADCIGIQGRKILIAGQQGSNIIIARFNPDGSSDSFFGTNGYIVSDLTTSRAKAMLVLPDESFVLAGVSNDTALAAKYSAGGVLQWSKLIGSGSADGLALNGSQIIVGATIENDFRITSYTQGGTLVWSLTADIDTSSNDVLTSLTTVPESKILAAGTSDNNICIMRVNANGTIDTSFGINGIVVSDVGEVINDIVVRPDNSIIVVGAIDDDFFLAEFAYNGSIEEIIVRDYGVSSTDSLYAAVTLDNNKIIVGGVSEDRFVVLGYNGDLTTNSDFDYVNDTSRPNSSAVNAMVVHENSLFVTGYINTNKLFVAKYPA